MRGDQIFLEFLVSMHALVYHYNEGTRRPGPHLLDFVRNQIIRKQAKFKNSYHAEKL